MSFSSPPASTGTFSLIDLEGAVTAILVGCAFAWPRICAGLFSGIERQFRVLARKPKTATAVVGLTALLLRLAILPIHPIPIPFGADDFSNLLAADTFSHGRLTNLTPAMWIHFETIHIDMVPTYMTMYFPGQGLVLAAGKLLFGHPWFGVMIAGALMSSALCWMLQAWLPPSWALLGGFLAVMRLALFSYWTSTYHNGGPISAIGGALVLGSLPRFKQGKRLRHLLTMSAGAVILGVTRPYEGFLLCLPVFIYLLHWILTSQRPHIRTLLIRAIPALALLLAGIAWLGYYDYRAFGSPLTLPYTVNRNTYATAPYYVWQNPRPEPHYRHAEMRRFYKIDELDDYYRVHSPSGLVKMTIIKALRGIDFFTGVALIPPLFMLPWALGDRRIRFLVICLVILAAGMTIEIYLFPHYLAPFTSAFYAVGLQALRHLYQWKPGGQPVGRAMTHWLVSICVLMVVLRLFDKQLNCPVPERPVSTWICNWFGPDHFVTQRSVVAAKLEQLPGRQIAIVRYSPDHEPIDEWVFNAADIDRSKVIWARDMGDAENQELLRYYKDRKAWLVQPDLPSAEVTPYPMAGKVTAVPSVKPAAWAKM
jgi:hypothetical protein